MANVYRGMAIPEMMCWTHHRLCQIKAHRASGKWPDYYYLRCDQCDKTKDYKVRFRPYDLAHRRPEWFAEKVNPGIAKVTPPTYTTIEELQQDFDDKHKLLEAKLEELTASFKAEQAKLEIEQSKAERDFYKNHTP